MSLDIHQTSELDRIASEADEQRETARRFGPAPSYEATTPQYCTVLKQRRVRLELDGCETDLIDERNNRRIVKLTKTLLDAIDALRLAGQVVRASELEGEI